MADSDTLARVTKAVRAADAVFQKVGGSTRHWVRDCFLVQLEEDDLMVVDKDEYDYLVWFMQNADFGPADDDVCRMMAEDYVKETGRKLPKGWGFDDV